MIVEKFKYVIWISIIILVLGLVVGFINGGLNLGIDFTGGSLTTVEIGEQYDSDVISKAIEDNGITGHQIVKSGDNNTEAIIRMQDIGDETNQADVTDAILTEIQATYPNATVESVDRVGGVASSELVLNAFLSVIVACALMLVYIWIRFELYSGVAAVIALAHDVGIMIAVMAIFRLQVNSTFIAACLTIVGYSINDTIVLLDRVRDNNKLMGVKKYTRNEIANTSIKQTIKRTLNTSITTLIMIVTLYICGVESIKEFSLPIIVGLVAGTYSSIFVAVPISAKLQDKLGKRKKLPSGKDKSKKAAAKA